MSRKIQALTASLTKLMKADEVITIMGEPDRIEDGVYIYDTTELHFGTDGRLSYIWENDPTAFDDE